MVTIRDIAKAAGVSPMTVSNVLNSHPQVRATTRARVLQTIDELGYRVNVAARNLRRGRTHTIGFAVPELDRPYFGDLATRVVAEAERHGLQVVIEETSASRDNELGALSHSRVRMYDGLILSAVGLGSRDADLLSVDFPMVILGERIFDGPVDHVAMPNIEGAAAAVRHLHEQGCRRVAGVFAGAVADADADVSMSSLRHEGYRRALAELSLPLDASLSISIPKLDLAVALEAVGNSLASGLRFDGIFCSTDYVAIAVIRALSDAGLRVPDDVKVIGFDNSMLSRYLIPSLSTVDTDTALVARTAVELLVARIDGDAAEPVQFVPPFRIVARESTRSAALG
ncbi:LacI family DNA-binding transcriptional regulator [Agromyces albus]|uniref:LacI family transcriptional regulator n=1 Tax=Agromyces albus TaxID=205332 RepID=A0A4V1QXN5_9MICO|nr:LacI family DNA-binding transcriptional regulator [Agromyces albus]RXZ70276.1 LacI family transcriptional regulator [Agromyces albus]